MAKTKENEASYTFSKAAASSKTVEIPSSKAIVAKTVFENEAVPNDGNLQNQEVDEAAT